MSNFDKMGSVVVEQDKFGMGEKFSAFLRSRRHRLEKILASVAIVASAGCMDAEAPANVDLLFAEPSNFNELPGGDVQYSITYQNNGADPINGPYDIQLRLTERHLGKRLPLVDWPKIVDGKPLNPGETAILEGVVTREEREAGGRYMTVILDPQGRMSDVHTFNNKYNASLPGAVVEPQCQTQVDENWGAEQGGRPVPDLDTVIQEAFVDNPIKWSNKSTKDNLIPYSEWPKEWKQELEFEFRKAWEWFEAGTPAVERSELPENLLYRYCVTDRCHTFESGQRTYFSIEDARRMYMRQVAGALAAKAGQWFSWNSDSKGSFRYRWRNDMDYVPSIKGHALQFDADDEISEADFSGDSEAMKVSSEQFADMPPQEILSFMKENHLIGKTAHDTVALFLAWSRRMSHVGGNPDSGKQQVNYWGYPGAAPISSILYGTVNSDPQVVKAGGLTRYHWIYGCWGTGYLLKHVLTAANIRTDIMYLHLPEDNDKSAVGGHALNSFQTEEGFTFLSHNDDPYNGSTKSMKACPEDLMNPKPKLMEWFFDPGKADITELNVGRRPAELDVERISGQLFDNYCKDRAAGLSPEKGSVYNDYLKHYFTLSELSASGLWDRLESRSSECSQWDL